METSAGQGARGTGKSVKGRIRKIPSESVIRLWRNFLRQCLIRGLEVDFCSLPFRKKLYRRSIKNPNPFPIWKIWFGLYAFGAPGGIRTHGLPLRRTRVVLFVHLISFDFLSFHLDLSRNSASFPKRQTGLIVGFVWLFRTPLLAEFQLFPIPRKPAIPSLPQGKEMQSRKERLALLCPAAFFCT